MIKFISECFVKPKYVTESSKKPYHLSPGDILMLTIDPIQKGLLFSLINHNNKTKIVSDLVQNLKHSLSIALLHFYPLAGRFTTRKLENVNASSIFIDCNKGPGARLIHATALNLSVSDILSPIDVTICHCLFDLGEKMVNFDGISKALLSIQVTELLDGLFIGFSINHSVVDGTSFIYFVSMLSEIYNSTHDFSSDDKIVRISRMPVFNYNKFWFDGESEEDSIMKIPVLNLNQLIFRGYNPGRLRERIFHFSSSSLKNLKTKANQECGTHNVVSSFLALTSFVWKSITKARNLPSNQETKCFLAIGIRGRVDPPVSDGYFGNIVSKAEWGCKVEELLGRDLGWAAMNLHKLIKAHDGKVISDLYKELVKSAYVIPRGFEEDPLGETGVIMGGSARFDMFGSEFGLGRALGIRMGYANKEDGKITASPGCEGDGSVDLEICLRPHVMATLESDPEFMQFVSYN
ncbi:unnamed protein product [Amaranthus hypochondriacus]